MLIELSNTPREYAWGSLDGIATFTGTRESGRPQAELWFGTHPASPTATIRTAPRTDSHHGTLADWLIAEPALRHDGEPRLPILLKVLAAASPLSLQVHPTPEQARIGFADENERGVPLEHPSRNYKDPFAKPEIIVAVTDFDALCGFRPAPEVAQLVRELERLADAHERQALAPLLVALSIPSRVDDAVRWLLGPDPLVETSIAAATSVARSPDAVSGRCAQDFATIVELAEHYPGDPGIVIAALMNRVALKPGESLFAPAGMLHAYLRGVGIELMTASDNVVRGGMTGKHVDVNELLKLLTFRQAPAQRCTPRTVSREVTLYSPPAPFKLFRIDVAGDPTTVNLSGPSIVLVQDGRMVVEGRDADSLLVEKGGALFASASETRLRFSGAGRVWVATVTAAGADE